MKTYSKFLNESLDVEAMLLMQEAQSDPDKMEILNMMLDEEAIANTASAPGIAMVSNGEPVSPKYSQNTLGKHILRRKKRKDNQ